VGNEARGAREANEKIKNEMKASNGENMSSAGSET